MIWMHAITWICGRPVFRWVLVSKVEFARTAHLTGAMIKLKAAKLAVGGVLIVCAGTGARYGPGIVAGGPSSGAFGPSPYARAAPKPTPEPGTLGILLVGIGGILLVRRRNSKL